MKSEKRAFTKAQQAPSGAQALRDIPSQVASAIAQRRKDGMVSQNSASMTSVRTALPGVPNRACSVRFMAPSAPGSSHLPQQTSVPAIHRGGGAEVDDEEHAEKQRHHLHRAAGLVQHGAAEDLQ